MTVSPNPGFLLFLAAVLVLICPARMRAGFIIAAALGAAFLSFAVDFGDHAGFRQIGLVVVPLRLDALSQVFGLAAGIVVALAALEGAQRFDPMEASALCVFGAGALCGIYAGDLVSYIAAAAVAGMGATVLTAAGRRVGGVDAGFAVLAWHVLACALLTVGAGLHWATAGGVRFDRIGAQDAGGVLILLGLLVAAAAPGAHVWLVQAVRRAGPTGAMALAALGAHLALYGLARGFVGEPALIIIGACMALSMMIMAAAEPDPRGGAAYGALSTTGLAIAAIGSGAPLALAAAVALGFAQALTLAVFMLTLNALGPEDDLVRARGRARTHPLTAAFALLAGLSALGAPGTVGYVAITLWLESAGRTEQPVLWLTGLAAWLGAAVHLGLRLPLRTFFGADVPAPAPEAAFHQRLAMILAGFLIVAIGFAPGWLQGLLPPGGVAHAVYQWSTVSAQLQAILAAGFGFGVAALVAGRRGSIAPSALRDLDSVYGWLGAGVAQWGATGLLPAYRAAEAAAVRLAARAGAGLEGAGRALDRGVGGLGAWATAAVAAALVAAVMAGVLTR